MDAIRKIEAALAAGPTEGPWNGESDFVVRAGSPDYTPIADTQTDNAHMAENAAYIAACQPSAIREVLQTLASKEAEIVRLRALLARYRNETPLGHQPHMIAEEVDAALTQPPKEPT